MKELATKPYDPSSIPRTHVVKRENSYKWSSDLHMSTMTDTWTHTHTHAHTKIKWKKKNL